MYILILNFLQFNCLLCMRKMCIIFFLQLKACLYMSTCVHAGRSNSSAIRICIENSPFANLIILHFYYEDFSPDFEQKLKIHTYIHMYIRFTEGKKIVSRSSLSYKYISALREFVFVNIKDFDISLIRNEEIFTIFILLAQLCHTFWLLPFTISFVAMHSTPRRCDNC